MPSRGIDEVFLVLCLVLSLLLYSLERSNYSDLEAVRDPKFINEIHPGILLLQNDQMTLSAFRI